jgi:four helix bundle protein
LQILQPALRKHPISRAVNLASRVHDPPPMGARHFTELVVWQLADDLRKFVHDLLRDGPAAKDWKFASQLRDASDGVCRNIAEGFGRYGHPDFARFLTIAKSSLDETEDGIRGGRVKGHWGADVVKEGISKVNRTGKAMSNLMRYLRRSKAPKPFTDAEAQARG